MIKTIVAGFISEDAKAFLQLHQVQVVYYQNLAIIAMDEEIAVVNETVDLMEYVVGFWTDDGNDILEDCVIIFLTVDSAETKLILRKNYWSKFLDMPRRPVVL
jgi:hypothetical protein